MKSPRLVLVLCLLGIATSCGPKASSRDQQWDQIAAENEKITREYQEAVGIYKGELKDKFGNLKFARLEIRLVKTVIPKPGRSEPIVVPSLGGYIETRDLDKDDSALYPMAFYTTGDYSRNKKMVSLNNSTTTSDLNATLNNDTLIGEAHEHYGSNKLHLKRVLEE